MMNKRKKILIVDDMPSNLQILGTLLKDQEYDIIVATNGVNAIILVEKNTPDLILLDVEMPDMNGFEVCKKLKENPSARDIPVIFLTARNTEEDIVAGFDHGAVDYISKPFNRAELIARVKTHIELKLSREEIARAYEELKKKDTIISNDLKKAREIQSHVISYDPAALQGLDVSIFFKPLIEVGGDIYDIIRIGDGRFRIFIADANGHGVQAALVTMLIKSEYDKLKLITKSPAEILTQLNMTFHEKYYRLVVLFTACIADIDLAGNRIRLSNAGHPYPYMISPGSLKRIASDGPMMGIRVDMVYSDLEIPFERDDTLLMFSDGLYEDLLTKNHAYQLDYIESIFKTNSCGDAKTCTEGIINEVKSSLDCTVINDDITLIAARHS